MEEQVIIGTPGKVQCHPASRKPPQPPHWLPVHPLHAFARLQTLMFHAPLQIKSRMFFHPNPNQNPNLPPSPTPSPSSSSNTTST